LNVGFIGGALGYRILRRLNPSGETSYMDGSAYAGRSKLAALLGDTIWDELRNKVVIDFGCGTGEQAVELAMRGARKVIGVDIDVERLTIARGRARAAGVTDRCVFATGVPETGDVVISTDAFEHFADPTDMLRLMRQHIKDDGYAIIEFGPTWYHPLGGHGFSIFPWSHLVFTERALLRWWADFKDDGATKFSEIKGGLNQMTIRRFRQLVAESQWEFSTFEAVPIRKLRRLANRVTREFTTAVVRCRLVPKRLSSPEVDR
jgi:SAM-dependent methyltransferase